MNTFRYLFITLSLCFFVQVGYGQTKKLKSEGEYYFKAEKYNRALDYLLRYQKAKPGDDDIVLKLGISFYHTNKIKEAKKYLGYLVNSEGGADEEAYYFMAKTLHADLNFKEAISYYKAYLKKSKLKDHERLAIKDAIRRCATGLKVVYIPQKAIVENLGDKVNTPMDEFGPILSPNYSDRMYFSSTRIGNVGGIRDEDGMVDRKLGDYSSDMYFTQLINGEWSQTTAMNNLLNSPRHDIILDFNSNGKVLFFYKGFNQFSGEIFVDTFKVGQEQNLYPPKFISPMIAENGDGQPFFVKDSILLFSSYRAGGYGGSDLYICAYSQGRWTTPENLGPTINSSYDETTPFLAMDGRTLYFSSNNRKSIGGLDIFKSTFDDRKQSWGEPVNLGLPINSAADDAHFRMAPDGLKAFCSSGRKESMGGRDLFIIYFNNKQREQQKNNLPVVFNVIKRDRSSYADIGDSGMGSNGSGDYSIPNVLERDIKEYKFKTISFETNIGILNTENTKVLNSIATMMKANPNVEIILTGNNDKTENPKFDLFSSIKSAEIAAQYLIEEGVNAKNIHLKGSGSNNPIAQELVNGEIKFKGKKLNRRIDIGFVKTENEAVQIFIEDPKVPDYLTNEKGSFYKKSITGISYKVEIASIKNMYHSDLILVYENAMVESKGNSEFYKYTVGLYKTFLSSKQLLQEIKGQGIENAKIVPYLDGRRILPFEMEKVAKEYPDLFSYMRFVQKDQK